MKNQAFIDGQNLYLGTTTSKSPWKINLNKLRVYLRDKYNVDKAYYFLGYYDNRLINLYNDIKSVNFILVFREHNLTMTSVKKGNVDTDVVFNIMKKLYKKESFNKIFLISGDGDYYKMVKFLIAENRLGKVLFPAKSKASSLYKMIDNNYYDALDTPDKIARLAFK